MDFSHYLFRCSSLGYLMAEEKGKSNMDKWIEAQSKCDQLFIDLGNMKRYDAKGNEMKSWQNKNNSCNKAKSVADELFKIKDEVTLSEGAKTHLMDVYISEKYGRKTDIENKYIKKGLAVEEDGITIYSRLKKVMFRKNEDRLKNLFIQGTPDLYIGEKIHSANTIIDIKCSWNIYTYFRTFTKDVNSTYYWQGMGYMWLTGAKNFKLAYCLVNTPESLIESEFKSLWYKLGCPAEDDGNFQDACRELRKSLTYDDIRIQEKLLEYPIERDDSAIDLLKKKVIAGREYLNQLDLTLTTTFA